MDNTQQTQNPLIAIPENLREDFTQAIKSGDFSYEQEISKLMDLFSYDEATKEKIISKLEIELQNSIYFAVVSMLTQTDFENLSRAFETGLTKTQQQALLFELYEQKSGESLLITAANLYDKMLNNVISEFRMIKESGKLAATLPEEVVDQLNTAFEDGNTALAQQLLDQYKITKSEDVTTESSSDDKIIAMIKEKRYDDAKKALSEL